MTIDQGVQSGTRNERSWFGRYGWVIFGFTMTVAYLVLVLWGLTHPNPFVENASTFEDLWNPTAKLAWNAFGDFLAGLFAPLAFLWLFTATMIQSQELALQRQELVDNRTVAKAQADEARKQAEYIGEQTVILKANAARENMRLADARTTVRVTSLMEWIENALPSELPLAAGRIVSNSSLVTRVSGARRFAIFAKSLVGLRESIVVENLKSVPKREWVQLVRSLPELEARLIDIYSLKDQVDEWTMSFGEIDPDKVMQAVKEMREILQLPWDKWESERDADDKTGRRVYSLMLWAHETLPGSLPLEREKDGYRELALKISLSSDPSRLLDFVQSLKDLRRGMVAEHLKTVPKAPWALLSDSIPDLGIHLAEIYSLRYQVDRWSGPLADPGWDELVVTVNEIREILGEVRWAT